MTLAELNAMGRAEFVAAVGWVFEGSPWVSERAWTQRPFENVTALHSAMVEAVTHAAPEEQLALICAHPDLGARAQMTEVSAAEQGGAGLDRLTPAEFERLQRLNAAYRDRFGFPFLYAVRGSTKHDVLAALEARLVEPVEAERTTALTQIYRIAQFRLEDLLDAPLRKR